jgi:branched-chain amino acid transport system ATP-binding protein
MTAILQTTMLDAFYGGTQALFGVDLAVQRGGITALLGANGAGKTTTLRAICAMLKTRGEVMFDGVRIDGLSTESIARRGVAHVPDGRGTFSELTVDENLRLGGYLQRDRRRYAEELDRVLHYFPKLAERRRQQAGTLSGGEQQMLAISRALMLHPRLMVLDEPSFGLAPLVVQEIFRILRRINQEDQVSVLLVEQNAKIALDVADHAYLLETGRIVVSGTARDLQSDEGVRRSYLGY